MIKTGTILASMRELFFKIILFAFFIFLILFIVNNFGAKNSVVDVIESIKTGNYLNLENYIDDKVEYHFAGESYFYAKEYIVTSLENKEGLIFSCFSTISKDFNYKIIEVGKDEITLMIIDNQRNLELFFRKKGRMLFLVSIVDA